MSGKNGLNLLHMDFYMSSKVNHYFTHMKRLKTDDQFTSRWKIFYQKCLLLKEYLGPILFQLPATVSYVGDKPSANANQINNQRFHDLAKTLKNIQCVFEFRHPSFYCHKVYDIFQQYDWCLTMVHLVNAPKLWAGDMDSGFHPDHPIQTASWGMYWRFHGHIGQYVGAYGNNLYPIMQRWFQPNCNIFIFFNNTDDIDDNGMPSAINDALLLQLILKH